MRIVLDLGTSWAWTRPPVGIVRTERKFARYLLESNAVPFAFCRFDKALRCYVEIETARAAELVGFEIGRGHDLPFDADDADVHREHAPPEIGDGPRDPVSPANTKSEPAPAILEPFPTNPEPFPARPRAPRRRWLLRQRAVAMLKRSGHAFLHRVPEQLRPEALDTLRAGFKFTRGSGQLVANWLRVAVARRHRPGAPGIVAAAIAQVVASPNAFAFRSDDVYFSMGLDWEYNSVADLYRERHRVGFRTVLFCYDTIPVHFPHLMSFDARQSFARYFVDLAHSADRIVAISQTSRRDFESLMDEVAGPKPPVDVVLLGTDLNVPAGSMRAPSKDLETTAFVLCVSTIEARKNHEVLYHAWDRLIAAYGDEVPILVIVGMVGWGVSDLLFRIRTNPRLKERIRILDNLADGELAWLYRNSLFTVFPSLYEGWGLPVVESLAYGKPCICSNTPAVVEATQGLATAIDPLDTPAWIAAIERLWRDHSQREQEAARCASQFRAQLWKNHAEELLAIAHREARS
jgi:glycosyltransferase involved in cell wall biosynthesis